MLRWWLQRFAVMFVLSASAPALAGVYNPDQITVFVPAFDGPGMLGRNVSTVLLLQIAQTSRRLPWPDNPEGHDFGEAMIAAIPKRTLRRLLIQ